jgi:hypothetical protein
MQLLKKYADTSKTTINYLSKYLNLEIDYDPNAFGHANKPIFYRKYFLHEVVTYGNGHYKLINREGEVVSEGAVFGSEEQKNTFRKYTGSEPYKHKR